MLLAAAAIFAYYTTWVVITVRAPQGGGACSSAPRLCTPPLLQPFLDADSVVQAWFPDRYFAIVLPAVLLVLAITLVMAFVGVVLMKSAAKKASKKDA